MHSIFGYTGSYSGSALANYVFGVHAWHVLHGQPWSMDDTQVKAALSSTANLAPFMSKCPEHAPFTISLIEILFSKLGPNDPLDASVRSCPSTSFYTLACGGEFTIPSIKGFDPTIHLKLSDVHH